MYIHCIPLFIRGWVNIITVNKIPWDGFNSAKRENAPKIVSYYITQELVRIMILTKLVD